MSDTNSSCDSCSLLQTEVALLRAELAGLKGLVINRMRHSAETANAPADELTLEIVDMQQLQRFSLSRSLREGPEFHRVHINYRNDLSATCLVVGIDSNRFLSFFEELGQNAKGWEGEKEVASEEGQLAITCTYEGDLYHPEVHMSVHCSLDPPSFDPYWSVQLRLELDPGTLEDLADRARSFFNTKL